LLQQQVQKTLRAAKSGRVYITVPPTFLPSAFGGDWQQAGFKVLLSVFKDSTCMAGRRVAAKQGPWAADDGIRIVTAGAYWAFFSF
jgi:hypothetical protein